MSQQLTQFQLINLFKVTNRFVGEDPDLYPKLKALDSLSQLKRDAQNSKEEGSHEHLSNIDAGVKAFLKHEPHLEFRAWAHETLERIRDTVSQLQQQYDMPDAYKRYEQERIALCQKYAQRDENGEQLVDQGQYVIDPNRQDEFRKEAEQLQNKYADAIQEAQKVTEQFQQNIGETDSGITPGTDIEMIAASKLPKLSVSDLECLWPVIDPSK